jgi:homopolymeric O-antigen transport system permease protein
MKESLVMARIGSEPLSEKIYTPDAGRRQGLRMWTEMVCELLVSYELISRLIKRDISVRYRQSVLGYVWAVIPPMITVAVFTILVSRKALPIGTTLMPYPVYALWGMTLWGLFAGCLSACTASLVNAGSLVTKIGFPKEAIVISAVGQPLFDFGVRLLPVIGVFAWYGVVPAWQSIFIFFLALAVVLMAVGLGFFLAIANLAVRDVANVVGMLMTFGMFFAPVLYPPPVRWPFFLVNILNPFSPLLAGTQDLLARGRVEQPDLLIMAVLFSLLVFLVGWRVFHLTMPRVAERA